MSAAPMRASDQDRSEAVLALSDHFADGRLDHDEFETRMSAAQQATYLHDLDPLFADLPGRSRPAQVAQQGRPLPGRRGGPRPVLVPFVLAALLTAIVLTSGHALWLLVPMWFLGMSLAHRLAWRHRAVRYGVGRRGVASR